MAIRAQKRTVTTTAQELSSTLDDGTPFDPNSISIKNPSTNAATVYLGGTDAVTVNDGFPIAPGEGIDIDLAGQDNVFAVCAAGTVDINILRTRE